MNSRDFASRIAIDSFTPVESSERLVIRLAERNWVGADLNNAVAKIILEEELGYEVVFVPVEGYEQFESFSWASLKRASL